jgi:hypothetical protein
MRTFSPPIEKRELTAQSKESLQPVNRAKSFTNDILADMSYGRTCFHTLATKKTSAGKVSLDKSFRRHILRGYLQNTPFVFMDLAVKRVIEGI